MKYEVTGTHGKDCPNVHLRIWASLRQFGTAEDDDCSGCLSSEMSNVKSVDLATGELELYPRTRDGRISSTFTIHARAVSVRIRCFACGLEAAHEAAIG